MKKMSQRKELFCYKYLELQNATDAYIQAGFKCSRETARRNSSRLLTNADIKAFIEGVQSSFRSKNEKTLQKVINQLTDIAFGGLHEVVEIKEQTLEFCPNPKLNNLKILKHKTSHSKSRRAKSFVLVYEDRIAAIELLANILGYFKKETTPHQSIERSVGRILETIKKMRKR